MYNGIVDFINYLGDFVSEVVSGLSNFMEDVFYGGNPLSVAYPLPQWLTGIDGALQVNQPTIADWLILLGTIALIVFLVVLGCKFVKRLIDLIGGR